MKTKLLCILCVLTLVLSSVSGVFAADINMSTKRVEVSGEFEGALKGTRYLAKVFNPGVKGNTEDYDVTEWYSYIHQGTVGEGGAYGFEYILPENAKNDKYEIDIILENGTEKNDWFYYFDEEYADAVAEAITTPEGDTDEIKLSKLLADLEAEKTRICLNANFELYDTLQDKSKAAGILLEMGTIDTRDEFTGVFVGITAAVAIGEANTSEVSDILAQVSEQTGLESMSTYKEYTKGESGIDSLLVSCGAENARELAERLSYYLIKEQISALGNWMLIQPTLEKYNDVLEIDFSAYEASDAKYDIIEYFQSLSYEDVEGIVKAFNDAVTEKAVPKDDEPENVTSNDKHESGKNSDRKTSSVTIGKGTSAPVVTPVVPPAVVLPDVSDSHWAKEYITKLVNKGVVSGDGNGNIRPDDNITREEFVKIMVSGLGISAAEGYVPFADVSETSWSSRYIQAARENQLVTGTTDGRFMPYESITRQDLFVILGRYLEGGEGINDTPFGFADEDTAAQYAKSYIAHLGHMGLVTGFSDGTVRPFESCTRAEAFAMLCRVIELNR